MSIKHSLIYRRLFIIYTIVIIFLLGSLDFYFIKKSARDVKENNLYINEKIVYGVNEEIHKISNSANIIINNMYKDQYIINDVLKFLSTDMLSYLKWKLDRFAESKEYYYKGVEYFTESTFNANEYLESITFISYDVETITKFNRMNQTSIQDIKDLNLKHEESYSHSDIICNEKSISYLREIREPVTLKPKGAIVLTYDLSYIKKILSNYEDKYELMLIDSKGFVTYDSTEKYKYEYYPYFEKLVAGKTQAYLDESYEVNMLLDTDSGILTLGKIKSNKINKLPSSFYNSLIFIDILLFIIVECLLYIKFEKLTERMDNILVVMEKVKEGKTDVSIPISNEKDELNFISQSFNDMCEKLDQHIKKSYLAEINQKEAELNQKKAEMVALQNQIDPHFLYNTLESIRMKAICNGDKEVGKMLYILAFLFRNQLKEKNIITIKSELDYCEKYIEIFKFRYEDKFKFNIECDDELLDKQIIKFTLQPLIENYFVHGIRLEDNDNKLNIKISKEGEDIIIVIKENGRGIPEEKLEVLTRMINNREELGKSIGILNAHKRIVMNYGEGYGIKIENDICKGTIISVKLPCREVDE
ncbi:sensor histidine kinase [Clostridium septicum]|uniref:Histidine kinase n=1 Tax=Clostridium septicum TaxID=1504 RepID=A0A9N7JL80_CLOSE|nr:histidine kinase [Clostridium septicum]AYE34010.1 sensor histidine kinase [Clostridium septicum]MDU1314541.1 histidine kinase [Clostridium septicum]QAS59382.1 sensor histidine kinase [Clostridium septicum]UEC21367.1 histidine kinase [Clostridium septicum]USS00589.1 histidine kinase [Clostridium septicum]